MRMILPLLLIPVLSCAEREEPTPPPGETDERIPLTWRPCFHPEPIMTTDGWPSGFVRCDDGSFNKVATVGYSPLPYEAELLANPDSCPAGYGSDCSNHDDCDQAGHEYCIHSGEGDFPGCRCLSLCSQQEDCYADQQCLPPELGLDWAVYPRCNESWGNNENCETGSGCETGECGLSFEWDEGVLIGTFCRSFTDECRLDEHCEYGPCRHGQCH